MKRHRLCKATRVIHGEVLRCQGLQGHHSAHFSDHYWWENAKGLPEHKPRIARSFLVAIVLLAAVIVSAVTMLVIVYHR